MASPVDEEFVAQVRAAVAERDFAALAAKNDAENRYAADSVAVLKELGVPSMGVAREYGGPDHSLATMVQTIEAVAYGDPSAAACVNMSWVISDILGDHAATQRAAKLLLQRCAERQDMFAGGASIPVAELDPSKAGAKFRRVAGGWRGSGRVGFATNSEGATFVGTIGVLVDERGDPEGRRVLVVNAEAGSPGLTVLSDWDALGLRGTATNTIVMEDLFVDTDHAFEVGLDDLKSGSGQQAQQQAAGYSVRKARSQISKGGMWLGHCTHIYDELTEFVRKRRGTTAVNVRDASTASRAELAWAQSALGELRHWVRSGRQVLYTTVDEIVDDTMDPVERTDRMLLAMYHLRRMCEETALATFRLAGAHGIVRSRPIERMFRDLVAYIATAYKAPELVEHVGKAGLGLPFTLNATGG